jgi:autotransporter-associated beta strand protein
MNHTSGVTLTGNVTLGEAGTNENNFNLVKAGASTLTLSGANTYTGSTTLNAGTLILANQNAIQNSTLVMTGGGNMSFSSAEVANAFTLGGLSASSAGSGYNIALTNNASTTYAGVLSGTGSLTKTGSGTLTLSGANTYNGSTTVNAGTLVVNGTLGASSTLAVANGATLGGTGTINGAATVNGNLRPGNSPGVLTFGSNLSLTSTASITMEINGTTRGTQYDGINVTGPLVYGGSLTFDFGSAFLLGGESFSLFNAGSTTAGLSAVAFSGAYGLGSFVNDGSGNWSYNSGGNVWAFSESNGQLAITTAVPEPSTGMLLLASLLATSWVIVRRRKIPMA